jgi:hypothetical protein
MVRYKNDFEFIININNQIINYAIINYPIINYPISYYNYHIILNYIKLYYYEY